MEVELAQAVVTVDNEMRGNIHYPQWNFIVDKLRHLEIANGSVWSIVADSDEENENLQTTIDDLKKENHDLKVLVSSILYEINALWNIEEMNEDVRAAAEKIDKEVDSNAETFVIT